MATHWLTKDQVSSQAYGPVEVTPQQKAWSEVEISRYWRWWSSRQGSYTRCFSHQVGRGIVEFARLAGVLGGNVLDYGCGPGFLTANLVDCGLRVEAVDFSEEAVAEVKRKLAGRQNWRGACMAKSLPTPLRAAAFDLLFCIETLEHLTDDLLPRVVEELYRLCRPGGALVVSTPCDESILDHFVYCPFCNAEFHARQHQRSFTPSAMRRLLEDHGFEVFFCEGIQFAHFQKGYGATGRRGLLGRKVATGDLAAADPLR